MAQVHGEPAYVPTVICDKLDRPGDRLCDPGRAVPARTRRRRSGDRGADARDHDRVQPRRAHVRFGLRAAAGQARLHAPAGTASRKPYRTKDGYACILPYSDRNWQDFYEFTGRTEFKDDPRFQPPVGSRAAYRACSTRWSSRKRRKRTTAEWVAFCDRVSIPCMPVMSARGPSRRSAREGGGAVRHRRASDRRTLSHRAQSRVVQRGAVPHPPPRAAARPAHRGSAGGGGTLSAGDRRARRYGTECQ